MSWTEELRQSHGHDGWWVYVCSFWCQPHSWKPQFCSMLFQYILVWIVLCSTTLYSPKGGSLTGCCYTSQILCCSFSFICWLSPHPPPCLIRIRFQVACRVKIFIIFVICSNGGIINRWKIPFLYLDSFWDAHTNVKVCLAANFTRRVKSTCHHLCSEAPNILTFSFHLMS